MPASPDEQARTAEAMGLSSGRHRAYAGIIDLLRHDTGMDFTEYRSSTIGRRIARRMALQLLDKPEEYLRFLRSHPHEVQQLGEDLLISATRFFRDAEVFETLQGKVIAPLVRSRKQQGQGIRLWSVGCSTGEEAYALAMIALEALGGQGGGEGGVQVFATDLNESAIRRARLGHYGLDIAGQVSAERLQRFFSKSDSGYRVNRALREACIFARHDVTREAPFSRLDIIACRNVMIYMEPTLQRRLLPILHYALSPGGTLVLGSAESAGGLPKLFKPRARAGRKLKLYSKVGVSEPLHFKASIAGPPQQDAVAPPKSVAGTADGAHTEADRIVLSQFGPPGVVVDTNLDVIEFRGRTSDFFEPAPGAASLNLMKLARGELGAYVRSAVLQARKQNAVVRQEGVWIEADGDRPRREIELQVTPMSNRSANGSPLFLVLCRAMPPVPEEEKAKRKGKGKTAVPSAELLRLRRSLASSQKLLATLSDEHQASRQEYQASNEEIASANEELQSTNEELETSKEELQSANEELNTVNEELRHSNAEQHQLAADLQNLITATGIPIVVLDRELRVRRYSPAAEHLLRLIPADIGRRIGDIRWSIPIADLDQLALATLAKGSVQKREVQDDEGHWFELRLHPYLGLDHKVEGVVAVLADIYSLKRLNQQQIKVNDLAEALTRAATNAIALLDKDLRVMRANQPFLEMLGDGGKLPARWHPPGLQAAIKQLGDGSQSAEFAYRRGGRAVELKVYTVPGLEDDVLYLLAGQ